LQNHFADAEGAGLFRGDGVLAGVGIIERINLALLENGTETERLVTRGVSLRI
jgi:hypothetical protein